MYQDFAKYFDPNSYTQSFTKLFDVNSAVTASKEQAEAYKQLSTIWANTYSTCAQKQLQMTQAAVEDCIEAMRELSTSKGVDELVSKQTEWSRKASEKAQTNAQELAQCIQKGQTQSTDIISKLMQQNAEWTSKSFQNTTQQASNLASNATKQAANAAKSATN